MFKCLLIEENYLNPNSEDTNRTCTTRAGPKFSYPDTWNNRPIIACWNINLLNNPNLWTNQETDPGNIKRNTCRKDRSHFVIIHIVFIQGEFSSTGIPHGSSAGSFNARGPAFAGGQDWKSHTPSLQRILEVKISLHMKAWNII